MMRATLLALTLLAGAPVVSRDGFSLKMPQGWKESAKLTEASKERLSPNVDGGALGWEKPASSSIARVIWLRSKHPSGVGVREELEAMHEVWKSEAEDGRVVDWKVTETKVLMTSTLTYRLGDAMDGKGKTVRQVAIAGVDREGKIRGWTLECGFPTAAAGKAEKECDALASSFAVTVPAKEFRAIEPPKAAQK